MLFIEAKKEELLPSLQILSGAVDRRQTMPILSNFLMRKKDNVISFLACDGTLQIMTVPPINVISESNHEIAVSMHKFIDIIRSLPEESQITIHLKEKNLLIQSRKSRFLLNWLPAEQFPVFFFEEEHSASLKIKQKTLLHAINMVYFAMAQQDPRAFFNGIVFSINENILKVIASDGHRMAYFEAILDDQISTHQNKIEQEVSEELDSPIPDKTVEIIIPKKTVLELKRLLKDLNDIVTISFYQTKIRFQFSEIDMYSKRIDAKAPDYESLFPKDYPNRITVPSKMFLDSLNRVSIFNSDKIRTSIVHFLPGKIVIESTNIDQEEAKEEIDVEFEGNPCSIGFNSDYLKDFFGNIHFDSVQIVFLDSSAKVLFEVNEEKINYILMPMRI